MLINTTTRYLLLLLLASCKTHNPVESTSAQDFFPLQSGSYCEYLVEKTRYISGRQQVTQAHVRRSVESIFQQPDGQQVYPIVYATKTRFNGWQTDSTHASWLHASKALEQENGQTIVRMYFPLSERMQWNFNAFNNAGDRIATAVNLGKPFQTATHIYPETVSIVYQDDSTLLSRKKYIEIYAANVGLIHSERVNLRYCYEAGCAGKGIIESGSKEVFTIRKSGKQ